MIEVLAYILAPAMALAFFHRWVMATVRLPAHTPPSC